MVNLKQKIFKELPKGVRYNLSELCEVVKIENNRNLLRVLKKMDRDYIECQLTFSSNKKTKYFLICGHRDTIQAPVSERGYKMNRICSCCKKVIDESVFPATTFEGFIRRFVHKKLTDKTKENKVKETITQTMCGNYRCTDNKLYYSGRGRHEGQEGEEVLVIKLLDGRLIGNAARLKRCGSFTKGSEAPAQRVMQKLEMPLIPFNIFEEAKMNLYDTQVVEQGKTEELLLPKLVWNSHEGALVPMNIWERKYSKKRKPGKDVKIRDYREDIRQKTLTRKGKEVTIKYKIHSYDKFMKSSLELRHFIGAMLLKIEEKYFLFDIDRQELNHYRFNAFLAQLPGKCKTIKEAYDMLIPKEVNEAIKKGIEVKRQGEWFFVPKKLPKPIPIKRRYESMVKKSPNPSSFDLDEYHSWRGISDDFKLEDKYVKEELAKLKKKYREGHLQRVKDYHEYVKRYLNALKKVHRANPTKYAIRGELRVDQNRPNYVREYVSLPEGVFVSGLVEHSGREHEPLMLIGWHKPIPNTATKSFTIEGDID